MKIYKKKIFLVSVVILIFLVLGGFFYWKNYIYLDPNSSQTYYKIFDKNEILNGRETTAREVDQKLDKRLEKYHSTFEKMAGTNDEKKLRALFYMNFVHMYGYYGERNLKEQSLKEILWNGEYFQCGTFTTFLAMLLDRAGYEYRTVSIKNGAHGYVEVNFDKKWQILDPTLNIWINKSTEELLAGQERINKRFFLKTFDFNNEKANDILIRVANVYDLMTKMGIGYQPKIDQYNYIDLSKYQY